MGVARAPPDYPDTTGHMGTRNRMRAKHTGNTSELRLGLHRVE